MSPHSAEVQDRDAVMLVTVNPARGSDASRTAGAAPGSGRGLNALTKLFHTTLFKLTLVYLTIFAVFAACLLGYFAWNTRRLITEQITRTVDAEITGLAEQYNQGGIQRLVFIIDTRARRPGSSLYLVTTLQRRRPRRQCRRAGRGRARACRLDRDASIAGSTIRRAASITRWCGCSSCRAASGCWSAATSKSASGSTTSSWPPANGRSRW